MGLFRILILIIVFTAVSVYCLMKFLGRNNDPVDKEEIASDEDDLSCISDPEIRELIKRLKEEVKSECIFDFFKGIDFTTIPDSSFTESTGKNMKGDGVKEYFKKLDYKVLGLFDELEVQFDGEKRHYALYGSHSKPPIKELRTAANAFHFKYGANISGKNIFDEKDENVIFKGGAWRSIWNITKQEKKAFALTWDGYEKRAKITIVDYSDRF